MSPRALGARRRAASPPARSRRRKCRRERTPGCRACSPASSARPEPAQHHRVGDAHGHLRQLQRRSAAAPAPPSRGRAPARLRGSSGLRFGIVVSSGRGSRSARAGSPAGCAPRRAVIKRPARVGRRVPMDKFTKLTGVAAPMPMINVDTDMIIPKQFLKTIQRSGLGKNLFDEMRYDAGRQRDPRLRAEPAGLPQRADPRRRREFRLRLQRASTRPGRCSTSASAASSRRASPTSSSTTASRTASCRSCCRRRTSTS